MLRGWLGAAALGQLAADTGTSAAVEPATRGKTEQFVFPEVAQFADAARPAVTSRPPQDAGGDRPNDLEARVR
jgi:hypothetical protein